MVINHNLNAMTAIRYMNIYEQQMGKAMKRLTTGLRINCAADDPSGLAISQKMEAQIRGLNQAYRNVQDSISVLQVADGALNETHSILQRMRELAVQAANGTYNDEDRKNLQLEFNQLAEEVNSVAKNTNFNTINMLDGSHDKMAVQAGPNSGDMSLLSFSNMTSKSIAISGGENTSVISKDGKSTAYYSSGTDNLLKGGTGSEYALDISIPEHAEAAISILDDAIKNASTARSSIGAQQNALEYRLDYLSNTAENLTAAQSRIMDADIAQEMMNYAKYSILHQAAQAMLAQTIKQSESIIDFIKYCMKSDHSN